MSPLDTRHHLMLNQQRLDIAKAISDEIEDCCEAMEEFNKDAKGTPGFVAPVTGDKSAIQIWKGWHEGQRKNASCTWLSAA